MTRDVELSSFDLRYEGHRMRNPALEARLLVSIQERGVEKPLEGVDVEDKRILLNGFKRLRCARRLGLGLVPYTSLGADEATGIVAMLRVSNEKSLGILEQAQFVDDLVHLHGMKIAEVAETLSRSKSWVVMRLGLVGEMKGTILAKVFSGAFPVYSYMYTLRPFMRLNGVRKTEVEAFVSAVSGKKLSTREIEQLAHGYFRGPDWFRQEVDRGNLFGVLDQMRKVPEPPDGCNDFERVLLGDLEILAKYMRRVMTKSQDPRILTRTFRAQANLLLAGIVCRMAAFHQALRGLHDRTGDAQVHLPPAPGGDGGAQDRS